MFPNIKLYKVNYVIATVYFKANIKVIIWRLNFIIKHITSYSILIIT